MFSPICFTNFFHEFSSVWAVEKENKLVPSRFFSQYASWKRNHNRYSLKKRFRLFRQSFSNSESKNSLTNNYYHFSFFFNSQTEKKRFCTNQKFLFFFNFSNWEKFEKIIGENKIPRLLFWFHELLSLKSIHYKI